MAAKRNIRDKGRQAEMVALYRAGKTLEQVGQLYGMTRERVRQIIAAAGITRADGGLHVQSQRRRVRKATERQAKHDRRVMRFYGCSLAEARVLNDMVPLSRIGSPAQLYTRQRTTAKQRDISWEITFPEWMAVWRDSGKFDLRGHGRGSYCMARQGDTGPYSVANVYITTCDDNVRDYQAELKVRGVVCADGFKRLPEKADRVSEKANRGNLGNLGRGRGFTYLPHRSRSRPYQVVVRKKYIGAFATEQEARAAYLAACESLRNK
ncbi:MAG TPA: sigma factor-like helix-turn-helix DNA-binding protein [Thiobacillus sp.]